MSAEDEFTQLYRVATVAGRSVAAGYQGYTTAEDMTQEAILWLLEHPERVEHAVLPDGSLYFNRLVAEVVAHLVRLARKEKSEVDGYAAVDRYAYSVRVIELVLPAVFDPLYAPPSQDDGQPRGQNDPAEGGNWLALVTDVRAAVGKVCSDQDRKVLFARSVGGWTWAEFGERLSLSGETHRLRYWEALRRVSAFLNDGVVVETAADDAALEAAFENALVPPPVAGDGEEDSWRVAGRDPYRPPDV